MTVQEALQYGYEKLKNAGIGSYQLDAEILLAKALFHSKKIITPPIPSQSLRGGKNSFLQYAEMVDRKRLYLASKNQKIKKSIKQTFEKLIRMRARRVPLAYRKNLKYFFGLPLFVDERVLIPRPETEALVEKAIKKLIGLSAYQLAQTTIVDIGTGSGGMIISLVKTLRGGDTTFIATDTSPEALQIANMNARIHGVEKNIQFLKTNTLPMIKTKQVMIVANLPYLDEKKKEYFFKRCPELAHEPSEALFTKEEGMHEYKKLLLQIQKLKGKQVSLLAEVDPTQKKQYSDLANRIFKNSLVEYFFF